MYWGGNPAECHPRHFTKYTIMQKSKFLPRGRKDRTMVLVDIRETKSAKAADIFLQVRPGKDFELITILRAMVKGQHVGDEQIAETGLTRETLDDLIHRMKTCKFGCIFFGMGLSMTRGKHMNSAALLTLAAEMNAFTKFVAMPMRGHGNVTGADVIMRWQTGYPFGISFNRGYPRYNPGEFSTVDVLVRGDCDAAFIIGADPGATMPQPAIDHLKRIPTIVLDPHITHTSRLARVHITTAPQGIAAPGTAYRMDELPMPLKPALKSPYPTDEEVVRRINEAIAEKPFWLPEGSQPQMLDRRLGKIAVMLRITGGKVYDPANGIDGQIKDLFIDDAGRFAASVDGGRTIDATGMIVFPGGVDVHTHVAGGAINFARAMTPEDHRRTQAFIRTKTRRSGLGGMAPTTFATGYLYAGMGFTTVNEAAVPVLSARHTHEELADIPIVDKSSLTLMANNEIMLDQLEKGEYERAKQVVAWYLWAAKSYGIKAVNPGRRRGLEMGQGRQAAHLAHRRLQQADARHHRHAARPDLRRPRPAAPDAPALQQPRRAGQHHHHARHAQAPGRPPRPHRPFAVPRLRRRRLGHDVLGNGRSWPSTSTRIPASRPTPARWSSATR